MILYGGGGSSKKRFDDIFIMDLSREQIKRIEGDG